MEPPSSLTDCRTTFTVLTRQAFKDLYCLTQAYIPILSPDPLPQEPRVLTRQMYSLSPKYACLLPYTHHFPRKHSSFFLTLGHFQRLTPNDLSCKVYFDFLERSFLFSDIPRIYTLYFPVVTYMLICVDSYHVLSAQLAFIFLKGRDWIFCSTWDGIGQSWRHKLFHCFIQCFIHLQLSFKS